MKDGQEAGRPRKRAEKRPADSKCRVQFHLGETLIERLGVHCSLAHKNQSAMVEEILASYLTRHGKGRELFKSAEDLGGSEGVDPAT